MQSNEKMLHFLKMHGAGNDFVIIDSRGKPAVMLPALARLLGDRHRGVGFDQLAEIINSDEADFELIFWNNDGTLAEACGNATRCVSDYMMKQLGRDCLTLITARGKLTAVRDTQTGAIGVNMGAPQLEWYNIPLSYEVDTKHLPFPCDSAAVGMGNPHCIMFVDDAEKVDINHLGPKYENDPLYPQKTNVEFVNLIGKDHLRMRVWERGAAITLACGSGACAAGVAAHMRGLTQRKVVLELDGGTLCVDWRDDGVWLSGPVAYVFEGQLSAEIWQSLSDVL